MSVLLGHTGTLCLETLLSQVERGLDTLMTH